MTIKLAELDADKNLPKEPIRLSSAKEPMRLSKVDKEGNLHFATEPDAELKSTTYSSLPLRDRAVVALALSESEPGNRYLYAIAGFYLECATRRSPTMERQARPPPLNSHSSSTSS